MAAIGQSAVLVSTTRVWDDALGDSTEYRWEGTKAGVEAVLASWRGIPGVRTNQDDGSGKTVGTIRVGLPEDGSPPGVEAVRIEYSLRANRVVKDLLEVDLPNVVLTQAEKEMIRQSIANNGETGAVPARTEAAEIYLLMLAGVAGKTVYQPTLTVVATGPPGFEFLVDPYDGVGLIWTTGDVSASIDPPFLLPSSSGPDSEGFYYGWLKHYPDYQVGVGQRVQETLEYEYGRWSGSVYSTY